MKKKTIKEKITLFFKTFGKFFQIRDDYINLTSFSYWQEKGLCTDIEEGKFTYPLIHSMTNINIHDDLYEIITSSDRYLQDKKLHALDMMQRAGSLSKTRVELDELKEELTKISNEINKSDVFNLILKSLDY